ncbi:MAG: DUF6314 family protein [Paracoccaceae bacterium]|jgi:hypothetical protein|nr:DUF6314 family protein [Paracoccaceae bacterium]
MKQQAIPEVTALLARLAGRWRVVRRIEDRLGPGGRFDGEAVFAEVPGGLDYVERGVLVLGQGAPMQAERRSLWRAAGARVAVRFADGRGFHELDPAAACPEARHLCGDDVYDVAYDFAGRSGWGCVWRVRGPRKDYRMVTRYARG